MMTQSDVKEFFFTYGTEGQPYRGGWTVVRAENLKQAIALFRVVHPDKHEGILNCADFYNEEDFKNTLMYHRGNFDAFCYERISLNVYSTKEGTIA